MATMSKEKNIMSITIEENKTYKFDVNTGVMLGLRGKPLKRYPAGIFMSIHTDGEASNVLTLCRRWQGYRAAESDIFTHRSAGLALADRFDSVGITLDYADLGYLYDNAYTATIQTDFKQIVKYYKQNEEPSLRKYLSEEKRKVLLVELNRHFDGHFTEEMADYIVQHHSFLNTTEKRRIAAYFLSHGLWDFLGAYNVSNYLQQYFTYCEALEWNISEKGNFMDLYVRAKRNYEIHKTELDDKRLRKNQLKNESKLVFENDDFEIVIPTTSEEFRQEAEAQRNCVYSMYLHYCLEGTTNVVFVRKKNHLDESYITCEVRNGTIIQYYLKGNHLPYEESDIRFREEYQKHLHQIW